MKIKNKAYASPMVEFFRLGSGLSLLNEMSHEAEWGELVESDREFGS